MTIACNVSQVWLMGRNDRYMNQSNYTNGNSLQRVTSVADEAKRSLYVSVLVI